MRQVSYTSMHGYYQSVFPEWRDKAMLLVVVEGFLSASPQLILQLSLAFKGFEGYNSVGREENESIFVDWSVHTLKSGIRLFNRPAK